MYLEEKHREKIADLELTYHISTILSNVFNPDPYVCNIVNLILCPFHKMFGLFDLSFWDMKDTYVWISCLDAISPIRREQVVQELCNFMNEVEKVPDMMEIMSIANVHIGKQFIQYVSLLRGLHAGKKNVLVPGPMESSS